MKIFIILLFIYNSFVYSFELNNTIKFKINNWIKKRKIHTNFKINSDKNSIKIYGNLTKVIKDKYEPNEVFKTFVKTYKKVFNESIKTHNIKKIVLINTSGGDYLIYGYQIINNYKYKTETIAAMMNLYDKSFNFLKLHNFVIPNIKLNITNEIALKKCINIVKSEYCSKSNYNISSYSLINNLYQWFYSNFWTRKKIVKILYHGLFIVIPNSFLKETRNPYFIPLKEECNKLRLAHEYIVIINQKPNNMIIYIWIDAENGKYIGGRGYIPEDSDLDPKDKIVKRNRSLYITLWTYSKEKSIWQKDTFKYNIPLVLYENRKIIKPYTPKSIKDAFSIKY